jgi:hypothetical protein
VTPDTPSYLVPPSDGEYFLTGTRTIGYSALLSAIGMIDSHDFVPCLHFAIYGVAVLVLHAALLRFGFGSRAALWGASALLYNNILLSSVNWILPEVVAPAAAILVMAALLMAVSDPQRRLPWVALGVAILAAYLLRPSNLVLVPLVPIVAAALVVVRRDPREWWVEGSRIIAVALALAFAPLLLICGARLVLAGNFGLVSFTGSNLIGIAGQLLTPEVVPSLAPNLRPLASAIIERREALIAEGRLRPLSTGYDSMANNYDPLVFSVARPLALDMFDQHNEQADAALAAISIAAIKARPQLYVSWVSKTAWRGVGRMIATVPVLLALAAGMVLTYVVLMVEARRHEPLGPHVRDAGLDRRSLELNAVLFIAIPFAMASLLLTVLVQTPLQRYTDAAGLFLPMIPAVAIVLLREKLTLVRGQPLRP